MDKFLSDEEVDKLIIEAKAGNNDAWHSIKIMRKYIPALNKEATVWQHM